MKKITLSILLALIISVSGCAKSEEKPVETAKEVNTEVSQTVVYCDNCGAESKEVTKYCSNCGAEAKWLAEKPEEIKSETKEDIKDEEKEEVKEVVKEEKTTQKDNYGKKAEYLAKLDDTEASMENISYLYEGGITSDMKEGEGIRYQRWDDRLNEIYRYLKTQLPEKTMHDLKMKQRSWVKYRDSSAQKASDENGGGTYSGLAYIGVQADITKERCYEMVNIYMK